MSRPRIVLATAGIGLALFGVFRLLTQVSIGGVAFLLGWLMATLVIHDGIIAPGTLGLAVLIRRKVPPRARRYLQGALISGAAVTVIALPMIYRAHRQPKVKALLEQNFVANLALLLAVIAVLAFLAYVVRLLRDRAGTAEPIQAAEKPAENDPGATS